MPIEIRSPNTPIEFAQRHDLLQSTLRQPMDPYQIEDEYPLLLQPDARDKSLCLFDNDFLAAHLNVQLCNLQSRDNDHSIAIALVGNVASHPAARGKGFVKMLMQHLEDVCRRQGAQAIFLWSDLSQFYQKLGFSSVTQEWRFHVKVLPTDDPDNLATSPPNALDKDQLSHFLAMRPKPRYSLERSLDEFATKLCIPGTLVIYDKVNLKAFAIIGKGADMQGVIHEWGAETSEYLSPIINLAGKLFSQSELLMLAPTDCSEEWMNFFSEKQTKAEKFPMALTKCLTTDSRVIDIVSSSFIWGLDSI